MLIVWIKAYISSPNETLQIIKHIIYMYLFIYNLQLNPRY